MSAATNRMSTIYRVAELIGRYRVEQETERGTWHVYDVEAEARTPAEYSDEASAVAGSRLQAACDILALVEGAS